MSKFVVPFCYLGNTLGAGGGVEEAARARVRCAWAKFKELSLILGCITPHKVDWACKLTDGCSLKSCVRPHLLAYATEIKSTQLHAAPL